MMQYIDNEDLREWVKKSLRKSIVLKAHELAMQTGCEVLLKIRDESINDGNFYYATESLQEEYNSKGLSKQDSETLVSGETGMPVYPKVSISTQSNNVIVKPAESEPADNTSSTDSNSQDACPLQLTVTDENDVEEIMLPRIKTEVLDEPDNETDNSMEIPTLLGDGDHNDLAAAFGMETEDLDNPSSLQAYTPIVPKMYQCGVCQKAFRSVQVLQKHTQTFHQRSNPSGVLSLSKSISKGRGPVSRIAAAGRPIAPKRHSCTVCSRSFPNVTLLNDHISRSHMMASAGFQRTTSSMDSEFNTDNSEGGGSSSDPAMPKISQVMSLQGSIMQIATSSDSGFTIGSPATSPIFQAGPSTSGAGTSSGVTLKLIQKSSSPSTRSAVAFKSTSAASKRDGWKTVPYEEIKVKNGTGYIIGDYIYSKDMHTQKGVMYLRCQTPKKMKCRGRAVIHNDKVKITRWHNHSPPDLQRLRQQEELLLLQPPQPPPMPPIDNDNNEMIQYVVENPEDVTEIDDNAETAYVSPKAPDEDVTYVSPTAPDEDIAYVVSPKAPEEDAAYVSPKAPEPSGDEASYLA